MKQEVTVANVDKEKVLAILVEHGPLRNVEIRRFMQTEEWDRAGCYTTAALQALKLDGRVTLLSGSKWSASDTIQCPACGGHGHIERSMAKKLGLVKA